MTEHTPGPWRIEYEPYCHVRSDAGCVLAADYTTPENASLIAAAPELLAALKNIVARFERCCRTTGNSPEVIIEATAKFHALIARATGLEQALIDNGERFLDAMEGK